VAKRTSKYILKEIAIGGDLNLPSLIVADVKVNLEDLAVPAERLEAAATKAENLFADKYWKS